MSIDTTEYRGRIARSVALAFAVCLACLTMSGCESEANWRDPTPATVFERFLMAWSQNQRETAYEMIDPRDRDILERPLEEIQQSVPESESPAASEMLVTGRVDHPFDLEDVTVENPPDGAVESGRRLTLNLTYFDEREGKATLVWRKDRWFVDLPLESTASAETADSDEASKSN